MRLGEPDGLLTTFTYGVPLVEHDKWRLGSAELCMSVRSEDLIWPHALRFLAEVYQGQCPFAYRNAISFGESVAAESAMTAFVVFAPAVLDPEDYLGIDVGIPGYENHDVINIQSVYPIHESERQFVIEARLKAFWTSPGIHTTCGGATSCLRPMSTRLRRAEPDQRTRLPSPADSAHE